jgi:hypothetical protein
MFCMFGRHSGDVWQTLHDNTSCGPLVVTVGLGAVTCMAPLGNTSTKIVFCPTVDVRETFIKVGPNESVSCKKLLIKIDKKWI